MSSAFLLPFIVATVLVLPLITTGAVLEDASFFQEVKAGGGGEAFSRTWPYPGRKDSERRDAPAVLTNQVPPKWTSLEGILTSPPCCVATGTGSVACFVLGTDAFVWVRYSTPSAGTQVWWQRISTFQAMGGELACVARDVGVVDVIALTIPGNTITVTTCKSGRCGKWRYLAGIAAEPPTCVSTKRGTADCIFRGIDNLAFHLAYRNGNWGSINCLGISFLTPLGCAVTTPDQFECFGAGSDNQLTQIVIHNGQLYGSFKIGAYPVGKPSVLSFGSTRTEVFFRDMGDDISQKTWSGNSRSDDGWR